MRTRDFDRERSWRRFDEDEEGWGRAGERDYDDDRGRRDREGQYGGEPGRAYGRPEYGPEGPYGKHGMGREGYGRESHFADGSDRGREGEHFGREGQGGSRAGPEGWGREGDGGPHVGRGPRNYQRSDERIREDVSEILTQHGQVDASDIEVDVRNGEVTLRGTVDSRRSRRMAEDAVEDVPGVRDVHNDRRTGERRSAVGGVSEPGTRAPDGRGGRLQLRTAKEVIGSNGDHAGRVKEVRDADFLVARRMRRDVYVPFSAVMHVAEDRVTLSIPVERADDMGWATPDAAGARPERGAARSMSGELEQPRPSTPTAVATGSRTREQLLARITEGLAVCDRTGDKIGTVGEVHRPVAVASRAGGRSRTSGESYLEVDTGFLGLGKTLYVPASSILDVTTDCVLLDSERDRVDRMDWDQRPYSIPE